METGRLRSGSIGVFHIVCFVIATAGPLVSLVGSTPAAFELGNGRGLPGTYLLVSLVYLIFSVGFTAMGRYVTDAGAFYAYITKGLGPNWGVGGALVAVLAYSAVQLATYALFGIFAGQTFVAAGMYVPPWWLLAGGALTAVHLLGRRTILFSGRLLAILLAVEMLILVLFDGGVAVQTPSIMTTLSGFFPKTVFAPGLGTSLAFIIPCFLGFEATAIFGEEARNPERVIPRATYGAVIIIGVLYAVSSWSIIAAYPGQDPRALALTHGPTLFYDAAGLVLGPWARLAMIALMLTSMFAALLSLHNAISRYFFSLGRTGILPSQLAQTHPEHGSPYIAGRAQSAIAAGALALAALLRIDPYTGVFAWCAALAALAILAVQCATSIAVVRFHLEHPGRASFLVGIAAPSVAAAGLAAFVILLTLNLHVIAGSDTSAVWFIPISAIAAGLIGMIVSRGKPRTYGINLS